MAPAPAVDARSTQELDQQDKEDVDRLESIIERIRNKTPALPYVVSVRSEFTYHPAKVQYDFRESRFDRSERRLEYSSFLFRDIDSVASLLRLEAQDMDQPTPAENTPRQDKMPGTNPGTPASGPKKKVSLADYKKAKERGQRPVSAAGEVQGQDKAPVPQPAAVHDGPAAKDSKAGSDSSANKPTLAKPNKDLPLSSSEDTGSTHHKTTSGSQTPATAPQGGPRRQPARPSTPADAATAAAVTAQSSQPSELPTPQSRKEARKSDDSRHDNPPLPVSPSSLRTSAALSKRPNQTPEIRIDDPDTPLPDRLSPLATPEATPNPADLRLSASTFRSSQKLADLSIDLPTESAFAKAKKSAKEGPAERKAKPSTSKDDQVKASPAKRTSEKRSREVGDDGEESGSAKRARTSDSSQRASQKAESQLRPGRGAVTTSSKTAKQGSSANSSTATPDGHLATPGSKVGDPPGNKPNQKWRKELSRLEEVGKRLKRQAQTGSAAAGKNATKLRLVQSIESVICFMTAFCANDQIRETHESWRSLSGFLDEVTKRADGWRHVQGLCLLLRASCCQRSVSILSNFKTGQFKDKSKMEEHLTAAQTYVQRADKFAKESDRLLNRAVLAELYPAAHRASDAIPLATPAVMPVIRTAMKFLGEWCKHESVDWTPQYEEGECSKL